MKQDLVMNNVHLKVSILDLWKVSKVIFIRTNGPTF